MWRLTRPDASAILNDPKVLRSMPRYVGVVRGKRLSKWLISSRVPLEYNQTASTGELWERHEEGIERYREIERLCDADSPGPVRENPRSSLLDLKVDLGKRIMSDCHFCERRCGVDRHAGETGYCRCGDTFALSSYFPHMGEEPELIPSGTIFTCGCTIRCIHCQNWEISQWREPGYKVNTKSMAGIVEGLHGKGCRNVNMVGGDPTPNLWLWLRTLRDVDTNVATIWNSNSYYSDEAAKLLAGFIDLYLLDFKYGNNECAEAISDAPGYWDVCKRNHLTAQEYGELLVRVLVLPGHNECCTRPILKWISESLGPWTRVNLMFQYRPEWRARERSELRRRLTREEIAEAKAIAQEAGLLNLVH